MFRSFLTELLLVLSTVSARIVETHHIADILKEIDQETLVLFDIDETTLTSKTTLGTSAWWEHFIRKLAPTKEEKAQLTPFIMPIVHKVTQASQSRTVEPETAQLINSLQERGITVISLTGRCKEAPWDSNFAEYTRDQLQCLGIDFEKSIWPAGVRLDPANPPSNYAYGIIFTNFQPKGPVLLQVLKELNFRPKKVVMVEDLTEFLKSVDQSLAKENIPFVGFRYSHLDNDIKNLDPMIGNIQLYKLLSDGQYVGEEEAAEIKVDFLKQNPKLSPDFYLEALFKCLREQIRNS
jgi:hypothetical protein